MTNRVNQKCYCVNSRVSVPTVLIASTLAVLECFPETTIQGTMSSLPENERHMKEN